MQHSLLLILYFAVGFILTVVIMPRLIKFMQIHTPGKQIRPEGPKEHLSKAGTPNMGGIIFFLILLAGWALSDKQSEISVMLLGVAAYGLLGLWDDLRQIFKARALGLKAREKLILQTIAALAVSLYLYYGPPHLSSLKVPGYGDYIMGVWFIPLAVLVLISSVNAVNLSDGLDGLAGGLSFIAGAALLYIGGLNDTFSLPGLLMLGSILGFMWFNVYPAKIFMGDTGAFMLGAFLALLAIFNGATIYFLVIGGVFALEALSVMGQVIYFKLTKGKRIFKMSPLHHHFCLSGIPETQVTFRFWVAGLWLAVIGVYWFKCCP